MTRQRFPRFFSKEVHQLIKEVLKTSSTCSFRKNFTDIAATFSSHKISVNKNFAVQSLSSKRPLTRWWPFHVLTLDSHITRLNFPTFSAFRHYTPGRRPLQRVHSISKDSHYTTSSATLRYSTMTSISFTLHDECDRNLLRSITGDL